MGAFEAVGVTPAEEQAYRFLLAGPGATLPDVCAALKASESGTRRVLASLEAKGLAVRSGSRPARFSPAPPDLALEALALQRQQEIEQARAEATLMGQEFLRGAQAPGSQRLVDLVEGLDAVRMHFRQFEASVTKELFLIDKPPYVFPPTGPNEVELALLARGVRCRVLYDASSFEVPGKHAWMEQCVAAGEEARVLANVPAKIDIADRRLAITFETRPAAVTSAVLVHPSSLLDSLMTLTDALWARAVPVHTPADSGEERDEALVALLASGAKDATIARSLGVSVRTLHRRVAELMDTLESDTRFQAGAHAVRRGWIWPPDAT